MFKELASINEKEELEDRMSKLAGIKNLNEADEDSEKEPSKKGLRSKIREKVLKGKLVKGKVAQTLEKGVEWVADKLVGDKLKTILKLVLNKDVPPEIFNQFKTYFDSKRSEMLDQLATAPIVDVIRGAWDKFAEEKNIDVQDLFSDDDDDAEQLNWDEEEE